MILSKIVGAAGDCCVAAAFAAFFTSSDKARLLFRWGIDRLALIEYENDLNAMREIIFLPDRYSLNTEN